MVQKTDKRGGTIVNSPAAQAAAAAEAAPPAKKAKVSVVWALSFLAVQWSLSTVVLCLMHEMIFGIQSVLGTAACMQRPGFSCVSLHVCQRTVAR